METTKIFVPETVRWSIYSVFCGSSWTSIQMSSTFFQVSQKSSSADENIDCNQYRIDVASEAVGGSVDERATNDDGTFNHYKYQ